MRLPSKTSFLACVSLASALAPPHLNKRLFGLNTATTTTTTTASNTKSTTTSATQTPTATASGSQKALENDFWQSFKARGVNLGNWLILEEWMDPAFYKSYTTSGSDEWTFCDQLGAAKCEAVLSDHWDSWIQERDITELADNGYNLLRIPLGHWALIPTTSDEPYVHSSQMDQVERILSYASSSGLYVVLDIHGLPGSQNGKDHSGHEGSIGWFTSANQKRSLTAVTAAMNFISSSPHKDVIAALEICNEPNITKSANLKTYEKYIKDATKIIHGVNASMPIMFHDGFRGPSAWSKFTKNKKDNYVIDLHKYFTGVTSNSVAALSTICSLAVSQEKSTSTTPVFVGEFSISVGGVYLDTDAWRQEFYETQIREYSGSHMAGSAFWSLKAIGDDGVTMNNGWSVMALEQSGLISNATWDLTHALVCPDTSGKSS